MLSSSSEIESAGKKLIITGCRNSATTASRWRMALTAYSASRKT